MLCRNAGSSVVDEGLEVLGSVEIDVLSLSPRIAVTVAVLYVVLLCVLLFRRSVVTSLVVIPI